MLAYPTDGSCRARSICGGETGMSPSLPNRNLLVRISAVLRRLLFSLTRFSGLVATLVLLLTVLQANLNVVLPGHSMETAQSMSPTWQ